MRIGLDIDDVVTDTSEKIEEYVSRAHNSQKLREHMKEIMKGSPSDPEVVLFCMENYLKVFQEVKMKNNAGKVIRKLIDKGHEIYLITARGEQLEFFRGAEEVTRNFLATNDIKYAKILFNATDKAQLCTEHKIDLMVDDSVEHCEDAKKAGVKSIVFTSRVNKDIPTTIDRVSDWLELEDKILELAA